MIAAEIDVHLKGMGPWVDPEATVDRFLFGDPNREIKTLAVAWKAAWPLLRQAAEHGADMFISHESLVERGGNRDPKIHETELAQDIERPKLEWLEKTGMTVYRCHDVWDRVPDIGVRDQWLRRLELGGRVIADEYPLYVTEIEPTTLQDLARHVLKKTRPLGQEAVLMTGDPDARVTRLATGTGVTHRPERMIGLGADGGLMTDDYFLHVREGWLALEQGFGCVHVSHGVAEAWGIEKLADHLRESFPDLDVIFLPTPLTYRTLKADD